MKNIKYYKGMSLGQWVEENDLSQLERDIRSHCEVYLEGEAGMLAIGPTPPSVIAEAKDLARLILISIRTELE